jgi:DNA-binding CsgD family transcriptional regulator
MKTFEHRLSALLLDVYEAAANPQHWASFLEHAARELDATKAALHVHYFAPGDTIRTAQGSCAVAVGYDAVSLTDYANYYAPQDLYVQRIRERFPLGMNAGTSAELMTSTEFRSTELYQDYCRPNEVFHNCWSAFEQNEGIAAGLGFIRPENTKPFQAKDVELLKLLNPHLGKAFHLQRILGQVNLQNEALLASVAQLDFGVAAIDSDGKVTNLSAPAKRVLDEKDGLSIRSGRLEALDRMENSKLQELLSGASEAITGSLRALGSTMLISRRSGKRAIQVSVFPFVSNQLFSEDRPQLLVFISDPSAKPVSRAMVLRSLYQLTPVEGRVADLLLEGFDVREVAGRLGITLETGRFNVKRILVKTGTRRQSELIRLMLSLPGQN